MPNPDQVFKDIILTGIALPAQPIFAAVENMQALESTIDPIDRMV
jgi:hypothetical protein